MDNLFFILSIFIISLLIPYTAEQLASSISEISRQTAEASKVTAEVAEDGHKTDTIISGLAYPTMLRAPVKWSQTFRVTSHDYNRGM